MGIKRCFLAHTAHAGKLSRKLNEDGSAECSDLHFNSGHMQFATADSGFQSGNDHSVKLGSSQRRFVVIASSVSATAMTRAISGICAAFKP